MGTQGAMMGGGYDMMGGMPGMEDEDPNADREGDEEGGRPAGAPGLNPADRGLRVVGGGG